MTDPVKISLIGAVATVLVALITLLRNEAMWFKTKKHREWQFCEQEREGKDHLEIKGQLHNITNGGLEQQIERHLEKHLPVAIARELEKINKEMAQIVNENRAYERRIQRVKDMFQTKGIPWDDF